MIEMNEAQVTGKLCVNEASFQGCGRHRKTLASYRGMWVISCSCFELFWESNTDTVPLASHQQVLCLWKRCDDFCAKASTSLHTDAPNKLWQCCSFQRFWCRLCFVMSSAAVGRVPVLGLEGKPRLRWAQPHLAGEQEARQSPGEPVTQWVAAPQRSHHTEQNWARLHKFSWKVCESFIAFRKSIIRSSWRL